MSDTVLPGADPKSLGFTEVGLQRLVAAFNRDIERKVLPGAVLLLARAGKIGFFEAIGSQDPQGARPMRRDSLFRIYSMTKPIASVALMMLAEEGRLKLDDPLARYLPDFSEPKVGVERAGTLDLVPAERAITLQDLLRHTAGLTYEFTSIGPVSRLYAEAGLRDRNLGADEFCRKLAALPLLHQPGTCWAYSHATDVVGRIVEVVSGQQLGAFLSERIFEPLGMTETGFSLPADAADRVAEALPHDPDTGNAVTLPDMRLDPPMHSGGGGLVSNAMAYARFCQMLANGGSLGGQRIIGRATLDFMLADHLGERIGIDPTYDMLPAGHGFGLGFAVRTEAGVAPFPASVGTVHWSGIAGTTFWLDRKEDLFAIMMIQAPGQRRHYRNLFRTLVYGALA